MFSLSLASPIFYSEFPELSNSKWTLESHDSQVHRPSRTHRSVAFPRTRETPPPEQYFSPLVSWNSSRTAGKKRFSRAACLRIILICPLRGQAIFLPPASAHRRAVGCRALFRRLSRLGGKVMFLFSSTNLSNVKSLITSDANREYSGERNILDINEDVSKESCK